jgi:predicted dehydrogenase
MNDKRSQASQGPSTSRRELLALGAAAAGASLLAGACASPGQTSYAATKGATRKRPQPGEPIKMGIIGMGWMNETPAMGRAHLGNFVQLAKDGHEKVQVVAISDLAAPYREEGCKFASEQQGVKCEGYENYQDLLARDDLHGVLIATPEHWHAKMAIDALMAGLDVYCEKPMTYGIENAFALRAVVHANPQNVFQVGTQYLQHRKYWKAKELIASGAIGKPTFTQTSYCRNSKNGEWLYKIDDRIVPGKNLDWDKWCGPAGKAKWDPNVFFRWRRYKAWSTGIIGDLLVHMTTPLIYALDQGWPTRVVACGGHYVDKAMENHDQVNLTVEFEKGHTLVIAGSTCNETGLEVLIRGHEANLYLGGNDCVLRPQAIVAEQREEQTFTSPPLPVPNDQDVHRLHWMSCMRSREQAIGDVDTAAKVMVIVDLATRSMWDKSAWLFDPATLTAKRA